MSHDGNEAERLIVVIYLIIGYSLKQHTEIEVIPACSEISPVSYARHISVTYLHPVVGVELAVAVCITVEEVAQLGTLIGSEIVGIPVDKRLHVIKV